MAPELYTLAGGGHKVDVYAFGVLLVEIWSRSPPFAGVSALAVPDEVKRGKRPAVNPGKVPPDIGELAKACWQQDPARRPEMSAVAHGVESGSGGGAASQAAAAATSGSLASYKSMVEMAMDDGVISQAEETHLRKFRDANRISAEEHDQVLAGVQGAFQPQSVRSLLLSRPGRFVHPTMLRNREPVMPSK